MKRIDSQTLDYIGNGDDEIIRSTCRNYRIYNYIHISSFIMIFRMLMKKFLNDV